MPCGRGDPPPRVSWSSFSALLAAATTPPSRPTRRRSRERLRFGLRTLVGAGEGAGDGLARVARLMALAGIAVVVSAVRRGRRQRDDAAPPVR